MGKIKSAWMAEQEKLGLAGDGVFSDYVNDEVWAIPSEISRYALDKNYKGEVVRDEYDLWVTHDGEGDN